MITDIGIHEPRARQSDAGITGRIFAGKFTAILSQAIQRAAVRKRMACPS